MEFGHIETLTLGAFQKLADSFDDEVRLTPDIDRFCSSSAWALSSHEAFHQKLDPILFGHDCGYVAMFAQQMPNWGRILLPLDASWFLACPLISREPSVLLKLFLKTLGASQIPWDSCLISGLRVGSPLYFMVYNALMGFKVYEGPTVIRRLADLSNGLAGFLGRRSAKFRKNLRRAQRLCGRAHFTFEHHASSMSAPTWRLLFERVMAVELRSWKGISGQGAEAGPMRAFYQHILSYQAPRGRTRLCFARLDGEDVGYILGGVLGDIYRGFQFSFDPRFRQYSLGNLLQIETISHLCQEGNVSTYDLGMDMEYKLKWSELAFETTSFIIKRT